MVYQKYKKKNADASHRKLRRSLSITGTPKITYVVDPFGNRNFTVTHLKFSLQIATMCIKYADKRATFRHIVDFANASTKYFHSGLFGDWI